MKDQNRWPGTNHEGAEPPEPAGALQRALYLWERQEPGSAHISASYPDPAPSSAVSEDIAGGKAETGPETDISARLQIYAQRLSAIEYVIPGDKRLDPPRFSLMMLNAFLGRIAPEMQRPARLPGLLTICDRIEGELAELEFEYPAALDYVIPDAPPDLSRLRVELMAQFSEFKSVQKAQQRQIISSLSALHAAFAELRADLAAREEHMAQNRPPYAPDAASPSAPPAPAPFAPLSDLAGADMPPFTESLIDPERLVDPRPVLAAARAAAAQILSPDPTSQAIEPQNIADLPQPADRSHRALILGTAVIGILLILFGRDLAQFFTSAALPAGSSAPS